MEEKGEFKDQTIIFYIITGFLLGFVILTIPIIIIIGLNRILHFSGMAFNIFSIGLILIATIIGMKVLAKYWKKNLSNNNGNRENIASDKSLR